MYGFRVDRRNAFCLTLEWIRWNDAKLQVKMAPLMAAFVASSAVVFMFLLVCPVFSLCNQFHQRWIAEHSEVHTTRYFTGLFLLVYSDVLLDIVGGSSGAV